MNTKLDVTFLRNESAAFALISALLRTEPKKEGIDQLTEDRVFDDLPYAVTQKDALQGSAVLKSWSETYRDTDFEGIYSDYIRLFVGPGKPLAPPWESTYNADGECLVFQKETLEVRKQFKAQGLQVNNLYHEPDDHIAYELEYIAILSERIAEALENGNEDRAEELARDQAIMFEKHVFVWAFKWVQAVQQYAETDFYRGIASLVQGFLCEAANYRSVDIYTDERGGIAAFA